MNWRCRLGFHSDTKWAGVSGWVLDDDGKPAWPRAWRIVGRECRRCHRRVGSMFDRDRHAVS